MSIRKIASGVALAALITSPALAADLDRSFKDSPSQYYEGGPIVNWSGFYVGGSAGYGIGTITYEDSPFGGSFESPVLSAMAGFDIARGRFVFGPFAEYTYITDDAAEEVTDWAVGLRAGYIVAPRTLLYGSLAYASLGIDDEDVNGLRAGIGTEHAIGGGLFLDLKANYTWYDLEDYSAYADLNDFRVLGGLKLKLNGSILD